MKSQLGEPDVYTVSEASRRLRLGRNATYEAIKRGEIPALRIGRRIVVPRAALEQLLARCTSRSAL